MSVNFYDQYPISWMPDKARLQRPIYVSLVSALKEDIATGALIPGMKLPSQRELADFLDINFTTITRAYKLAEQQGLIAGTVGKGTFISSSANSAITISKDGFNQATIDLGLISSIDTLLDEIVADIKGTFKLNYFRDLLNYNDPTGMVHQKKTAQRWLRRLNIEAALQDIAITSGGQNALALILLGLFQPGDAIAVDEYTYPNFINLARLNNITLVPVAMDDQGMRPEHLAKVCQQATIKGIFLTPSCSNPTTIHMPLKRKEALVRVLKEYQLLLLEDDVHGFLSTNLAEPYVSFKQLLPEQTIFINGLSKSLYSGIRVAFVVLPRHVRTQFVTALFNVNVKTSSVEAEIACSVINGGYIDESIAQKMAVLTEYHQIVREFFPEARMDHPYSFHVWLPIADSIESDFEQLALKQGVRVFHSDRFTVGPSKVHKFLRVALGSVNSAKELKQGLTLLQQALAAY